jgi:hypothetical protein
MGIVTAPAEVAQNAPLTSEIRADRHHSAVECSSMQTDTTNASTMWGESQQQQKPCETCGTISSRTLSSTNWQHTVITQLTCSCANTLLAASPGSTAAAHPPDL